MAEVTFDYLKEISPDLYRNLINRSLTDSRIIELEAMETKTGLPNIRVTHSKGKMTLHSNYDVIKECEKLYQKMEFDSKKLIIVFGIGMAYHIDFLTEQNPHTEILVVEPSYKILEQTIRMRDLSHLFKNSRLRLLISHSPEELGNFISQLYNVHAHSGLQFFNLPSYEKIFMAEWETIKQTFRKNFSKFTVNTLTIMEAGNEYTENCMRNAGLMNKFPWAYRLFGQFRNIPAIVVSAGPSLHKHIEQLKNLDEQAVIIAVDTAYSILMNWGISAHFVCSADPTSGNYIHLQNAMVKDSYMIIEPMTYHKIARLPDVRAFMTSFNGYYSSYFAEYAKDRSNLVSWGSIASTCFDLARKLECNPITFVGQDFAYSDFLYHCPGTRFDEKYVENIKRNPSMYLYDSYASWHIRRIDPLKVELAEDLNGEPVFTSKNMTLYAQWFEEQFLSTQQTVINASERGILKNNCKLMKFAEVVQTHMQQKYPIRKSLQKIYQENEDYHADKLVNDIDSKLNQLSNAIQVAHQLTTQCRQLIEIKETDIRSKYEDEVRRILNHISANLGCGLQDAIFNQWIDHENQKAELFFKRKIGTLVGQKISPSMVEELANHYYGLIESRIVCFQKIQANFKIAQESLQEYHLQSEQSMEQG